MILQLILIFKYLSTHVETNTSGNNDRSMLPILFILFSIRCACVACGCFFGIYISLSLSLSRSSRFPDTDLSNFQITLPSARLRPTEGRLQIVRTSTLSRRRISPLGTFTLRQQYTPTHSRTQICDL